MIKKAHNFPTRNENTEIVQVLKIKSNDTGIL